MTDQEMSQPPDQPADHPPKPAAQPPALAGLPAVAVAPAPPAAPAPPSQPTQPAAVATPTAPVANASNLPVGRQHAPPLGTRIEVLWRIESAGEGDEAGEIVDRWWGAVVQECTSEAVGAAAKPEWSRELVHVLLYDAWGEFGEDTARVGFLPAGCLIDLARLDDENGGVLDWRREGEASENVEMSLVQFADEQEALVHEAGLSKDADLAVLSQYPANVQINVASGYRVFADGVKEMLGELVAAKPAGYVVTEADVESIFQKIQQMKNGSEQVHVGM